MGYTHYWKRSKDLDKTMFIEAKNDCQKICDVLKNQYDIQIQKEYDDSNPPIFNDDIIRFNGIEDDGHETFLITSNGNDHFQFCKTAEKPYDLAVQCCLLIFHYYFKSDFTFSSDGGEEDWANAVKVVNEVFDYNIDNPFCE